MKVSVAFSILCAVNAVQLKTGENGEYFITGRSCGILNTIKYLNEIPEKIEDYPCSYINVDSQLIDSNSEPSKSKVCKYFSTDS